MFQSARLKLTAWYLFIMMLVAGLFSVIIYRNVSAQLGRALKPRLFLPETIAQEILEEQKQRLIYSLLVIDSIILVTAGVAGYFLAGITLAPIKQSMERQNQFISNASHELRTPIATLRAEMEGKLLEKNISNMAARNLISSNLEELDRLQKLSENLLRLSREEEKTQVKIKLAPVSEIIGDSVKKVEILAKKKQILILTKPTKEKLLLDKENITEILIILLDNAIKYSKEKTEIEVRVSKKDNQAILKVIDHGEGISPEDIPHIFERFYRADKSRSQAPGHGLGLSIAKKIVEEQGGEVSVESQVGKGTTFEIKLPELRIN